MNTTMRYVIEGLKDYERCDAENKQLRSEIEALREQLIQARAEIERLKTHDHAQSPDPV